MTAPLEHSNAALAPAATPPLPNFLGLGVQRGGTTWVHECLREHPEVFVPQEKELQFFNFGYEKGLDHYRQFFAAWQGQKAIGEISPNYYYNRAVLERIKADLPGVRLFVIFRNPVERAFSQYQLMAGSYFKGLTFRQACQKNDHLIDRGRYNLHLRQLHELFRPEDVRVLLYDDLAGEPKPFIQGLYRFLGVDDRFVPKSLHERYNRIIFEDAQRLLARLGLGWGVELVKKTPLGGWIKRRHHTGGPSISREDRAYLCDAFRQDMAEFQQMLGQDLSHWLAPR